VVRLCHHPLGTHHVSPTLSPTWPAVKRWLTPLFLFWRSDNSGLWEINVSGTMKKIREWNPNHVLMVVNFRVILFCFVFANLALLPTKLDSFHIQRHSFRMLNHCGSLKDTAYSNYKQFLIKEMKLIHDLTFVTSLLF